ncbi:hypothetical protein F4780DRAFT_74236 [Xylariomycetidae sp. FL0641]|nr:hypothetical protein F4780DRAFT_74236 [Xylariomycetidae sp. FL0641]
MDDTAAETERPRNKSRASTGCVTCRLRKVKCDEQPGGCNNCNRLGFKCSFSVPSEACTSYTWWRSTGEVVSKLQVPSPGPASPASPGVPKRRARQACEACHTAKIRCSAETPQCKRCKSKDITCKYDKKAKNGARAAQRSGRTTNTPTRVPTLKARTSSLESRGVDPSKPIIRQHIDAFFEFVHPTAPFSFIHRGGFLRTWHAGKLSKSLICVVAAVASRYLGAHDGGPGQNWVDEAEREITRDFEVVSLPKLQILLLLVYDRIASGKLTSAWYLVTIAARIAYGLRLNYPTEKGKLPFLNQECRRRLMWCTYIIDKMITGESSGYPLLCPRDTMHIQLPCNIRSFALEIECETRDLGDISTGLQGIHDDNLGVTAYLIRILDIRDQVRNYLKHCHVNQPPPWAGDAEFWRLHQQLVAFGELIPPDLRNTDRALFIRVNAEESTAFIMTQTWWHLTYCELFGYFVQAVKSEQGQRLEPPEEFVTLCTTEMIRYALLLSTFWRAVAKISKSYFVTDWFIGPCIFENTKNLIRAWELSPSSFPETASMESALAMNLEILEGLASLSPYVSGFREESEKVIRLSEFASILDRSRENRPSVLLHDRLDMETILTSSRKREYDRFPRHEADAQNVSPTVMSTPAAVNAYSNAAQPSPAGGSQFASGQDQGQSGQDQGQFGFDAFNGLYGEDVTTSMLNYPISFDSFLEALDQNGYLPLQEEFGTQ